ncbi:MAG: hypothetical protein V3W04_06930 [Gammaproteobacteria bacterium]
MIRIKSSHSRWILFRMLLLFGLLAIALFVSKAFIQDFYFGNQLTTTGMVINAGIIILFMLGCIKIISILLRYSGEESALARFVRQIKKTPEAPGRGVSAQSMIMQRYNMMKSLHEQDVDINHSALAATLVADESTSTGFVRFINNILILTGVFGTIVSLSIALLGASELFESVENIDNMGMVIHGMSAALSTTMTAIVCYVLFGYFYYKLADAQTLLISSVEQVTAYYLVPNFTSNHDRLNQNIGHLVSQLRLAAEGLIATQTSQDAIGATLKHTVNTLDLRVMQMSDDMETIKRLLHEGFRLPADMTLPTKRDEI